MLGNEAALWEVMLAAIKLGAVLIPTAGLLARDDLRDRITRGGVRHVITGSANAPKVDALGGDFTRISVGEPVPGWLDFAQSGRFPTNFTPDGRTRATDPLLLYFTSGTTAKPKLVLHTHQSYPVGHLSTMYWIGLRPGDIHLNISSPVGKTRLELLLRTLERWGVHLHLQLRALRRERDAGRARALSRHDALCATDRLAHVDPGGSRRVPRPPRHPRTDRCGEPLNPEIIERVQAAWGITVRDGFGQTETTAVVGNSLGNR